MVTQYKRDIEGFISPFLFRSLWDSSCCISLPKVKAFVRLSFIATALAIAIA